MKVKAVGYWILIKPMSVASKTASGIHLPQIAQSRPVRGEVISVGKEVKQVKPGQIVFYKRWTANDFKWEGTDYILAKIEDLNAIDERGSNITE